MMRREIEVEEWTCRAGRKREVGGRWGRLIRGYNEVDGNPCTDNFISAVVNPLSIPRSLFLRHLLHLHRFLLLCLPSRPLTFSRSICLPAARACAVTFLINCFPRFSPVDVN